MENIFNFCPSCGSTQKQFLHGKLFQCPDCRFSFYRNPAVAVGAFILNSSREVLLVRRAKAPSKGKLALPGGFIDEDETAEEALHREISEELRIKIQSATYLSSHPNLYCYDGIDYPVLDLFFVCETDENPTDLDLEEVLEPQWFSLTAIDPDQIAFDSIRNGLRILRQRAH